MPPILDDAAGAPPPDLGRRMASGALWMVALRVSQRAIGLVSTIILARLLVPEDFGLVALATTFAAILEVAGDFGVDTALICDRTASRREYDTAFTVQVLRGLLIGLVLVAGAPWIAAFFGDPRLEPLFWVIAAGAVVQGFWNIGIVDFRRDLEIAREFAFHFWGKLGSFLIAVGLALLWRSYWALIVAILARRVILLVLSYTMCAYRPRLSLAGLGRLLHVSKWLLLQNALFFLRERIDALLVGKLMGPAALGLYDLALEVASLPTSEVAGPVNRAVFPGYARMGGDRGRLRRGYCDAVGVILLVTVPASVGIGLLADPLVLLLLGEHWRPAVPLIQALVVFGVLRCSYTTAGAVYLALGRLRVEPALMLLFIAVLVPSLYLLTGRFGVFGAALALTLATASGLVANLVMLRRLVGLGVGELFRPLGRTFFATAAMAAAIRLLPLGSLPPVAAILLGTVTGAAVFLAVLAGSWLLAGRPAGPERGVLLYLAGFPMFERPLARLVAKTP